MIVAVAFCPHPPVLVPDVAQGAAPELAGLRAACATAVARIALPGRRIAVVGSGDTTLWFEAEARGTFAGFGVPLDVTLGATPENAASYGSHELPLSLAVGAWLLKAAGLHAHAGLSVGDGAVDGARFDDGEWALLVMGDGSARRSIAAPGYLDERAEPFDTAVVDALRTGRGAALTFDAELGADVLAAGTPAWNAVGALVADATFEADVLFDDAPFGVGYVVATWT